MRTTSHPIFPLNIDSLRPLHIFRAIGAAQARSRSRAEFTQKSIRNNIQTIACAV
jgi:hypothetical protein